VVFLENEILYGLQFDMSDEAMSKDFVIPIGKAKIEKTGKYFSLCRDFKPLPFAIISIPT
jgi:pyruvate dehydrogenase E1 component beta subunit